MHSGLRQNLKPGEDGKRVQIVTNCFEVTELPTEKFYHYDVEFGGEKPYNRRRKLELIDKLQIQYAQIFSPRAAFDGEKNMFRSRALPFPNNYQTFPVALSDRTSVNVTLKMVAQIDPRNLRDIVTGRKGVESRDLMALTLLNVLVRMKPIMTNPSNARSFFIRDTRDGTIGGGLEMWRGYFQSVRLSMDRLTLNIDITSAVMYQSGSLVNLARIYLNKKDLIDMSWDRLSDDDCRRLERFLKGLLVSSDVPGTPQGQLRRYRPIKSVLRISPDDYFFDAEPKNGDPSNSERLSVTEHFFRAYNYRIQLRKTICIGFSRDIVYPIEVLTVKEGQFYRKTLSGSALATAIKFATQKPNNRLNLIARGSDHLGHSQSDFMSGMTVATRPMQVPGRFLVNPQLCYSRSDGQIEDILVPSKGVWNVLGRRLADPRKVLSWAVILFVNPRLNEMDMIRDFVVNLIKDCCKLGMSFPELLPPIIRINPASSDKKISDELDATLGPIQKTFGALRPTFLLVILPESAGSILNSVKHWGDCHQGCPTQCLRINKVLTANSQYRNNVALKLNLRIGGINWIPRSPHLTTLAQKAVMVVGADVSHGDPGSNTPSLAGLVASVDTKMCRYIATTGIQRSHEERIVDMKSMIKYLISMFHSRLGLYPERMLFYRDGLSEGQFENIAHLELSSIKAAFGELGITCSLTYLVVGKRHHIRFFPNSPADSDPSGNCLPGLVVDQSIVHPIEYDFYLQSHAGILGTSRAGHYTLIANENKIPPDALQSISYAFCHGYGRATRSVSIPAPVYYADLVCRRGKFHSPYLESDGGSQSMSLEEHQRQFKPIHSAMITLMYWI